MPAQALTSEFLVTLSGREPETNAICYFDTEIKGFLLEHRASGGATFYFRYRDGAGKVRMENLGRADEVSLQDARSKAHKMKLMVKDGGDPKKEAYRFKDVPTFGRFVSERYLPYAKTRKRSWKAHTVRGVFAGALKKKLGLTIASEKTSGPGGAQRIYRIAEGAQPGFPK